MFVGGYTVFTLSESPSDRPCVRNVLLCPPNRRGWDILFLVQIPSASASASASALLRFHALSFELIDRF